jgi:hypothetical protein
MGRTAQQSGQCHSQCHLDKVGMRFECIVRPRNPASATQLQPLLGASRVIPCQTHVLQGLRLIASTLSVS